MGAVRDSVPRPTCEATWMSKPWRIVLILLVLAFVVNVGITYLTMY